MIADLLNISLICLTARFTSSEFGWNDVSRNVFMRLVISVELIALLNLAMRFGAYLNVEFNFNSSQGIDSLVVQFFLRTRLSGSGLIMVSVL